MASETRQTASAGGPAAHSQRPDAAAAQAGADAEPPAPPVNWASWRYLWQAPAIVASLALIFMGLRIGAGPAPMNDFEGALQQIEQWLERGELDQVHRQLSEVIEPNLAQATLAQRARFHALVADWIALTQAASQSGDVENYRRITEQYSQAVAFGFGINAVQVERWAEALIALKDVRGARQRISQLEAMVAAGGQTAADARQRRNRVLRKVVEFSLRQPDLSYDELMQQLTEFRADRMLSAVDEAWAVARQAELRLEAGLAEQAVDRLLIDMRRLEPHLSDADALTEGELYVLLGRAYFNLGQYDASVYHLNHAIERIVGPDPLKGDALVLLGSINQIGGLYDDAYDLYDEVVRDYVSTPAHLRGLLGRAEVLGIMGDHQRSLADYEQIRQELPGAGVRRDVTPLRVALSMADRHDASLTAGQLETALAYVLPAEAFLPAADVPAEILLRIASTSRQLADNIEAAGLSAIGAATIQADDRQLRQVDRKNMDPAVLQEAYVNYRRAADYAVRHARAVAATPTADAQWSDSLWMGADSYDLSGWHDKAALHFKEYLTGTSESDPRRAEAMFRLAQAYQADANGNYGPAISAYEQLISEYPKSPYASRSYVPLAVCSMASDRRTEAEQQLLAVLKGERFLKPDAADYREAQLALGRLYYDSGDHRAALEHLDAAVRRYPDDPRIRQTLFYLADSYRNFAAALKETIDQPTTPRAEREQMVEQRRQHLEHAGGLFDQVIERYETTPEALLDNLQRDQVRLAHLYRSDAAFDLAQYGKAIELYDYAARKYSTHHSSMVALVQIVNCYHLLGDAERARTAHARALVRLSQLPPEAFDAPDAIMNRAAWEDWLRNSPLGQARVVSAEGT